MERLNPQSRRDAYGSKINRDHSPVLVYGVPWLSILLGSMTPLLPIIAPAPVVPPFALMIMLAWRVLRPGLLPLWAGFPLGLFDDLFSGQPFGSAILLFSLTLIALELIDLRFPWRVFWQDWLTSALIIAIYLVAAALLSGTPVGLLHASVILPQLLLSIALFPIFTRMVALLDRLRLLRVRRLG